MRLVQDFRMAHFAFALVLSVAANVAPLKAPSTTITKDELRTDPPRVIRKKLKDQIWNMFEQEDYRRTQRPQRALTGLLLKTRTVATGVPG